MIGYPIDSHVTFNSQGIPSYDRAISSEPLRKLIKSLFSDGVLPNPSTNMQVQAGEGMTVIVNSGFAICNGCMKLEEKARTLVVQASSTSLDRIDTVILRLNNNEDVRSLDFYVLQGTPATNPVRPSLTQNDTIWEIGLADVFIASNTSVITNQRITDTRYETARCGIISSISEFDTTTLYNQIQADLDAFRNVSEADFTLWVNTIQANFESWKTAEEISFEAWMTQQKSDFDTWFDTIQSQLSGDVAANLQAQIGSLPALETQDKSDLVSAINELTTKLSKLNSDGTLDFSNVDNAPTSLSGYGITDAYTKTEVDGKLDSWHKYNGAIEENTVNTTNTDETITFHSIDTTKAYELWFDTSDGQQASVKSSLISGTDITYTVNTPTAQTKFRLLVKGI